MCPQQGLSFGIYLKRLLCGKFPPISKGHITATARGRGAGGAPLPAGFCHWNSKDHSCPPSALAFLSFSPRATSVLPGHQSPIPRHPLSQLSCYQMRMCRELHAHREYAGVAEGRRQTSSFRPAGVPGAAWDPCCLEKGQVTASHHLGVADRHPLGPHQSCLPTPLGGPAHRYSPLCPLAWTLEFLLLPTNFGYREPEKAHTHHFLAPCICVPVLQVSVTFGLVVLSFFRCHVTHSVLKSVKLILFFHSTRLIIFQLLSVQRIHYAFVRLLFFLYRWKLMT